jgi:pimeloyl-ACP methyl ester carboxylesterase
MKTQDKLLETLKIGGIQKFVEIGKYRISYLEVGKGSPLLLIHGANIGWAQWYKNIPQLAQHFTVYAIELPGAGASTKIDFAKSDFEKDFVQVVDSFVDQLKLENLDVVGSSFGGWVALRLAIENKSYIRRVVVANPIGFTAHMPLKFRPISFTPLAKLVSRTALAPVRTNKNLEQFMRDVFYYKNQDLSPEFVDYFYELSESSHNLLFISRLAHWSGMRPMLNLKNSLKKDTFPTLVIWGKEDPLMPFKSVEDNFRLIPNVQVLALDKVGHMPPVEVSEVFNQHVIKFLSAPR